MTTEITPVAGADLAASLAPEERADLVRHEQTIERGMAEFLAVGEALADIRDRRLYRESHRSFTDYVAERWPQVGSRRSADRLIAAAEVEQDLRPIGLNVASESQARELTRLEPEERREAMRQAVETAGGKTPTAAQVKAAAEQVRPAPKKAAGGGGGGTAKPERAPLSLTPLNGAPPVGAATVLASVPAAELPPLLQIGAPATSQALPPPLFEAPPATMPDPAIDTAELTRRAGAIGANLKGYGASWELIEPDRSRSLYPNGSEAQIALRIAHLEQVAAGTATAPPGPETLDDDAAPDPEAYAYGESTSGEVVAALDRTGLHPVVADAIAAVAAALRALALGEPVDSHTLDDLIEGLREAPEPGRETLKSVLAEIASDADILLERGQRA